MHAPFSSVPLLLCDNLRLSCDSFGFQWVPYALQLFFVLGTPRFRLILSLRLALPGG